MNPFPKPVRIIVAILLGGAFAVSVPLVFQHLGSPVLACGTYCDQAQSRWFSVPLLIALAFGSAGGLLLLIQGLDRQLRLLSFGFGASAIFAFSLMFATKSFCPLCLGAQFLWVSVFLVLNLGWVGKTLSVASFAMAMLALQDAFALGTGKLAEPVTFKARAFEPRIKGSPGAVVIFTDPLCPFCRADEQEFQEAQSPVPVLYRWNLLAAHGDLAVKLAATIESAKSRDAKAGAALFHFIYEGQEPPSAEAIAAEGVKLGFKKDEVLSWLNAPESASLNLIAADSALSSSLGVQQIPSLAYVDTIFSYSSPPTVQILHQRELRSFSDMTGRNFTVFSVFFGDIGGNNK